MNFDINVKSAQLLEKLANSIHDRDKDNLLKQHFTFSITEIQIVEKWLLDVLSEYKKSISDY